MSPTSTSVSTYTRTQTATYLTDVVMGAIADILSDLKIDVTVLYRDWKQDEAAIAAWIEEESLQQVVLECHQPNGTVAPIIEFPVAYTETGKGDATFTADRAALARYRAKLDGFPLVRPTGSSAHSAKHALHNRVGIPPPVPLLTASGPSSSALWVQLHMLRSP